MSEEDAGERDGGATADASDGIEICSGCPTEERDASDSTLRVHHVHLNVTDAEESIAFYEKYFDAQRVRLNGVTDALYADPILILLDERDHDVQEDLAVGLEHIGLGVEDVIGWFEQATANGLEVDLRNGTPATPLSFPVTPGSMPLLDPQVDDFSFVYFRAPNGERIEVWSGRGGFRHIHFLAPDVDATIAWYEELLGVEAVFPMAEVGLITTNAIALDRVYLDVLAPTQPVSFVPTDDQPLSHLAISVSDLAATFEHVQQLDLEVVSEPAMTEHGFRSFFVRAPQEALLELVEAGPIVVP